MEPMKWCVCISEVYSIFMTLPHLYLQHVILEEEEKEIEEEEEEEEEEGSVVNTPDFQPPPVVPDSTSPSLSPPSALTHLLLHVPRSGLACRLYHAPKEEQGIRRRAVCGISNLARNNVAWQPSSGLLINTDLQSPCYNISELGCIGKFLWGKNFCG